MKRSLPKVSLAYFSKEMNSWVIPISQGKVTMVSEIDAEDLGKYYWYAHRSKVGDFYAARHARTAEGVGEKIILMHRMVLDRMGITDPALEPDHINGNKLDNRRENLRGATRSQNNLNRPTRSGGFHGVRQDRRKKTPTFQAYCKSGGRFRSFGNYRTAEEAARVRDAALRSDPDAKFIRFNFPSST